MYPGGTYVCAVAFMVLFMSSVIASTAEGVDQRQATLVLTVDELTNDDEGFAGPQEIRWEIEEGGVFKDHTSSCEGYAGEVSLQAGAGETVKGRKELQCIIKNYPYTPGSEPKTARFRWGGATREFEIKVEEDTRLKIMSAGPTIDCSKVFACPDYPTAGSCMNDPCEVNPPAGCWIKEHPGQGQSVKVDCVVIPPVPAGEDLPLITGSGYEKEGKLFGLFGEDRFNVWFSVASLAACDKTWAVVGLSGENRINIAEAGTYRTDGVVVQDVCPTDAPSAHYSITLYCQQGGTVNNVDLKEGDIPCPGYKAPKIVCNTGDRKTEMPFTQSEEQKHLANEYVCRNDAWEIYACEYDGMPYGSNAAPVVIKGISYACREKGWVQELPSSCIVDGIAYPVGAKTIIKKNMAYDCVEGKGKANLKVLGCLTKEGDASSLIGVGGTVPLEGTKYVLYCTAEGLSRQRMSTSPATCRGELDGKIISTVEGGEQASGDKVYVCAGNEFQHMYCVHEAEKYPLQECTNTDLDASDECCTLNQGWVDEEGCDANGKHYADNGVILDGEMTLTMNFGIEVKGLAYRCDNGETNDIGCINADGKSYTPYGGTIDEKVCGNMGWEEETLEIKSAASEVCRRCCQPGATECRIDKGDGIYELESSVTIKSCSVKTAGGKYVVELQVYDNDEPPQSTFPLIINSDNLPGCALRTSERECVEGECNCVASSMKDMTCCIGGKMLADVDAYCKKCKGNQLCVRLGIKSADAGDETANQASDVVYITAEVGGLNVYQAHQDDWMSGLKSIVWSNNPDVFAGKTVEAVPLLVGLKAGYCSDYVKPREFKLIELSIDGLKRAASEEYLGMRPFDRWCTLVIEKEGKDNCVFQYKTYNVLDGGTLKYKPDLSPDTVTVNVLEGSCKVDYSPYNGRIGFNVEF